MGWWSLKRKRQFWGWIWGRPLHSCARVTHFSQITLGRTCYWLTVICFGVHFSLGHSVYNKLLVMWAKRCHSLANNFTKCWPILKFFPLNSKFPLNSSLQILLNLKHVATLPFENIILTQIGLCFCHHLVYSLQFMCHINMMHVVDDFGNTWYYFSLYVGRSHWQCFKHLCQ